MTDNTRRNKRLIYKALKITSWILGVIAVLFVSLVLIIRSESGQNFIIGQTTKFVSKKIDTPFSIDRLFLTFTGNLQLEGLYLEDQQGDTLIYSKKLEASVALIPLIKGQTIDVDLVDWDGLTARVTRADSTKSFNFDYIIDAFRPEENTNKEDTATTSAPSITVGTVDFSAFDLRYLDEVLGIDSHLKLGAMSIEMNEFSLDPMVFDIDKIMLRNTSGFYHQTKEIADAGASGQDTTSSALPLIRIGELLMESIHLSYHSPPASMYYDGAIGRLKLEVPEVNLNENIIRLDRFLLDHTTVDAKIFSAAIDTTDEAKDKPSTFEWPEWTIEAKNLTMNNNQVQLTLDSTQSTPGVFNPSQIQLTNLSLDISAATLQNQKAQVRWKDLSFEERSGLKLSKLAFDASLSDEQLILDELQIKTNYNELTGSVSMTLKSVDQLISKPTSLSPAIALSAARLSPRDAYYFAPDLRSIDYLKTLESKRLSVDAKVIGNLEGLAIDQFTVNWGNTTSFDVKGKVYQPTVPHLIRVKEISYQTESTNEDIALWMSLDSAGLDLPERISFSGQSNGSLKQFTTQNLLKTADGDIEIKGSMTQKQELIEYAIETQIRALQVGKIINNPEIGAITARIKTEGKGNSLASLNASLTSHFDSLSYSGYDFTALTLNGSIENGQGGLEANYQDDNLNLNLTSDVSLDSTNTVASLLLNLKGAEFRALGITDEDVRAQLKLDARFEGNTEKFEASLEFGDMTIVKNQDSYSPGPLELSAHVTPDSTSLEITSEIINGSLHSNTNPQSFLQAVNTQFVEYLNVDPALNRAKLDSNIVVTSSFSIHENTLISDVLLPDLETYDSITFTIDYHQNQDSLVAEFNAPYIKYGSSVIDSLRFELLGAPENLQFSAGWASIDSDPILLKSLELSGRLENQTLITKLVAPEEKGSLFDIRTELKLTGDTLDFYIQPDTFIINRRTWTLPESNRILIASDFLGFNNFNLSSNNQYLSIENFGEQPYENIRINFEQFKLSNFGSFLNPEDTLAAGLMNGKVSFEHVFTNNALLADFNISDLTVMGSKWGNLQMTAEKNLSDEYAFKLSLREGLAAIDLSGEYVADPNVTRLNLDLDLVKLETKVLQSFLDEEISDPKGYLTGHLDISGITEAPEYNGEVVFNDAGLKVNSLNTSFKVVNEKLRLDNKGVYFDQFGIQDQSGNTFRIGGKILTEDLINPDLNLTLKANNFMALDSKKEDNELFYGKVGINADLTINGTVAAPVIRGSAGIRENSDFTVVVPETQADLVEREGVVMFVNRKNPDAILTRTEDYSSESQTAFQDIDMNVDLNIGKKAIFRIIINERTGDNFQVSGEGDFNFGLEPNGRTTLAGVYNVSDGHFEASLYNLVKRRFDLAPGGTIKWSGDPIQATLDVSAIYELKTSPAPLMAAQTTENPEATSTSYQQKMPFLVYLNVDGTILEPEISFGLDVPEDERGSLGGKVYTKVQQLNNSEEQLNKQVFALLVLNRFYPASGSDGGSGGAASIARNNVNNVLSGQLNKWSNKLTGDSGFQLDFGLNSYTNYQGETAEDNTDLNINASQRLFNNRVIVQVGSEVNIQGSGNTTDQSAENTPLVGNVSLEYLITENGRYRFKGFRKNQYENIIDGQLIVTGFAFIFNREFNRFKDIFANSKEGEFVKQTERNE
ncbi:translocation/assembly module TamB domain-containing protein [Marinoscillum sp.]|uniref:translocation/assembly module TamB domain-containing protein n=1 Tax=Marinoscillum sp. TaxID=2024838 RepID=UPI003BACBC31